MNKLVLVAALLVGVSCGKNTDSKIAKDKPLILRAVPKSDKASDKALAFLNAYVTNCNKEKGSVRTAEWVASNKLTTNRFKAALKTILDEAYKADPELGLDADPLIDAQDYPDEGFELASFDSKTNYVVVRGKNWPNFKLTLKMVAENNTWLVDGCGIINIPTAKRSAR
jgi:hypothetical protein